MMPEIDCISPDDQGDSDTETGCKRLILLR